MRVNRATPFLLLLVCAGGSPAQTSPAADLLAQSIAYHDPDGRWAMGAWRLTVQETRPEAPQDSRTTVLEIDNGRGTFAWRTRRDGADLAGELAGDRCALTLNGSTEISDADRDKHRLTCDRLRTLRNYYTYLWGLPMKLRDPGTRLDPEIRDEVFQETPVRALRVTYEAGVGKDTWFFYFDRERPVLAGYRFHHDEAKQDGEFIVLDGEVSGGGLRLPARRAWYVNQDGKHLGTDTLTRIEPLPVP